MTQSVSGYDYVWSTVSRSDSGRSTELEHGEGSLLDQLKNSILSKLNHV